MTDLERVKGPIPLEEIPYHYGGDMVTVDDAQWSRVVEEAYRHLPGNLGSDLEHAHGALMMVAFEYGTRCKPGDEPLLDFLSEEEYVARVGDLSPRSKAKAAGAEARAAGRISTENLETIERRRAACDERLVGTLEGFTSDEDFEKLRETLRADAAKIDPSQRCGPSFGGAESSRLAPCSFLWVYSGAIARSRFPGGSCGL